MPTVALDNLYLNNFSALSEASQYAARQVTAISTILRYDYTFLPCETYSPNGHPAVVDLIKIIESGKGEYECERRKEGAACRNHRDWGYWHLSWKFEYLNADMTVVEQIVVKLLKDSASKLSAKKNVVETLFEEGRI
jgi:hypothetical protein